MRLQPSQADEALFRPDISTIVSLQHSWLASGCVVGCPDGCVGFAVGLRVDRVVGAALYLVSSHPHRSIVRVVTERERGKLVSRGAYNTNKAATDKPLIKGQVSQSKDVAHKDLVSLPAGGLPFTLIFFSSRGAPRKKWVTSVWAACRAFGPRRAH